MKEDNMRTFENARLLRLNLCQLNAMSDDELAEELRINQPRVDDRVAVKVKNGVNVNYDIRKTWATASNMDKGRPPEGLGVSSSSGFIR